MFDIEQKVFKNKKIVSEKLLDFGFVKFEKGYTFLSDIMDGDFRVDIKVLDNMELVGKIFDNFNNDEYINFRIESFNGSFVNKIRKEYTELLEKIADFCCYELLFFSPQANRISRKIFEKYGINPSFPWKNSKHSSYATFRHKETKKWFALIMDISWDNLLKNDSKEIINIINLKLRPEKIDEIIDKKIIFPGYHMNHKNWASLVLNNRLDDDYIMKLVDESFLLTNKKK